MARHCGASQYHDGALSNKARTRGSRKTRGRKKESIRALLRRRSQFG